MKKLGLLLIILTLGSYLGLAVDLLIPFAKWVDILGGSLAEFIRMILAMFSVDATAGKFDPIFLHLLRVILLALGTLLVWRARGPANPQSVLRWRRFRSMKLGWWSLRILGILLLLAAADDLLVGKRALIVKHGGKLRFPVLEKKPIMGREFGVAPEQSETDYRKLQKQLAAGEGGSWVLMPIVPYDSRNDSEPVQATLETRDGLVYDQKGKLFTGQAFTTFKNQPDRRRMELSYTAGLLEGESLGRDFEGAPVERLKYQGGKLLERKEMGQGVDFASLDAKTDPGLQRILFAPTPPLSGHKHYLGTDTTGHDVLAVVFGGFQMAVATSLYYVPLVYMLGIIIGCCMGYFGGWVDLAGQRGLEVWGAIPFLFVVILVRSVLPNPTPLMVTTLLAAFGWLGIAAYMRTGAYREKTRDYVAAARLQGASTGRIIFHQVLPNSLATIVTLIPFTVDHLIFAMTSLDFLGFGLPPGTPTWGGMLSDGTDNLNAPWILLSGFTALVSVLLLVTFVGEAIREAFDPKRFTIYR